tara:strand:+ start:68 stop:994 length:927 start_codon:yes stop_codon:yes gene_type:complete
MADNLKTVAEIVAITGADFDQGDFSDIVNRAPFLAAAGAKTSSNGKDHKYILKSVPPTVGFISGTVGRDFSKLVSVPISETLEMIDASIMMPKVAADASDDREGVINTEIMEHLQAAMFEWEKQCINGTFNAATGFSGMADMLPDLDNPQVLDGQGTGTALQSVYMVRVNGSNNGIAPVMNYEIEVGSVDTVTYTTPDGKQAPHYYCPIAGYTGLQRGNNFSICRIANLDATNTITDDLLSLAYDTFPAGSEPNMILMSRSQRGALKRSRTATTPTGVAAANPVDYEGIPLVITDAIQPTEIAIIAAP